MSAALLRSTASVGQMTLLSRVTGFLRDMVLAQVFGASAATDAFFVAFRIPNLFRRLFAEGSFAQAFVPVLTEYKEHRTLVDVRALTNCVAGSLLAVVAVVGALGVLFAPAFIRVFAPGFDTDGVQYGLAVDMLRITFPYLPCIAMAALVGAVLNTYGRFWVPAFTPVLLNVAMIAAMLTLAPRFDQPIVALAWGVLAGGVAQLLFQIPYAWRIGLLPRPRLEHADPGVRRVMRLMLPTLFGGSVSQLNILLNTIIASHLVAGSVSWLYYADRLIELPFGVFSVALGTVLLPRLAARHSHAASAEFEQVLDWGLRAILVITVPAALGLALLAGPILCTLFNYGAMTEHDVRMAARALSACAIGLVGMSLVKILTTAAFARQDTVTPVRAGVVAVGVNMILSLTLVQFLAHVGLALASALATFVNAALVYRQLRGSGAYAPAAGWGRFGAQLGLATLVMAATVAWLAPPLSDWLDWRALERVVRCAALVAVGVIVYLLTLWASGVRYDQFRGPRA